MKSSPASACFYFAFSLLQQILKLTTQRGFLFHNWNKWNQEIAIRETMTRIHIRFFLFSVHFLLFSEQPNRKEGDRMRWEYQEEKCRTWSTQTADQYRPWQPNCLLFLKFSGFYYFEFFLGEFSGKVAGSWIFDGREAKGNREPKDFAVSQKYLFYL